MSKVEESRIKRQKTGGRKKGTPNKKSQEITDRLAEIDCDPIMGMARIAVEAESNGEFVLAGNMYKELAQYIAPKRKAVEVSGDPEFPLETVTRIELVPLEKDS